MKTIISILLLALALNAFADPVFNGAQWEYINALRHCGISGSFVPQQWDANFDFIIKAETIEGKLWLTYKLPNGKKITALANVPQ